MDSKKLTDAVRDGLDKIGLNAAYNTGMEELAAIATKLPPKDFFLVSATSASEQALALTMSRHMLAIPTDGTQAIPGDRSGVKLEVLVSNVSKRLEDREHLVQELEFFWLDILQGLLVQDERVFLASAVNKSDKRIIENLNDDAFLKYIEEREEVLPGQYTMLLSTQAVEQVLTGEKTYSKLEKNIAQFFNPAVKGFLAAVGILGKFGEISLMVDSFRYDTLRMVWPEGLLAICVGPRSEAGLVQHLPVDISWEDDTAKLTQYVNYYDFLAKGECVSFWQKGRTVG